MHTQQKIIFTLAMLAACACNKPSAPAGLADERNEITAGISHVAAHAVFIPGKFTGPGMDEDTITTIRFREFSLSINRLVITDRVSEMGLQQKDTVRITPALGETFEGQDISVSLSQLTGLRMEQRYETSVSISYEGPHCDLTEWKHYNSEWKRLKPDSRGAFIADKYTIEECEKFPPVSMDELKQKVREECGEHWFKWVENAKSATDYPSMVGISRYFLRVTGKRNDNGKTVSKLIIVEMPMGC